MQLSMAGLAARGGMAVARPFGLAAPPQRQRRPTQRPVVVAKANADEERPLYSHWVARLQACMQLQAVATHERISEPELSELAWLVVLANVGVLVCAAAPSTLWGVALAVALCRWQVPRVFLSKGKLLCALPGSALLVCTNCVHLTLPPCHPARSPLQYCALFPMAVCCAPLASCGTMPASLGRSWPSQSCGP